MNNIDYTKWPVMVQSVRVISSNYTKNAKEVKATTYLVYVKTSMFQTEQALPVPLYKGSHDNLIAFYDECELKTVEGSEDKIIDRASIDKAIEVRYTKWQEMSELQKTMEAAILVMDKDFSEMTEAEQQQVGQKWATLPLMWNTNDMLKPAKKRKEGTLALIKDSLPIGDGSERFYVIDTKTGNEIVRTQGGRAGEKVSQTHCSVGTLVQLTEEGWRPLRSANTLEGALQLELRDQIDRGRFKKALSAAEQMAAIKAMSESMNNIGTSTTNPAETPAPTEAPATAPATT